MIGVPIARILGIEIRVQLAWILVLALIGALAADEIQRAAPTLDIAVVWGLAAVVAAGFFVSSAIHDLVHAIVARSRGVSVPSIAVSFFGGSTPLDPTAPNARDDLAIAVAGPLASLGIAGAFGLLAAGASNIGADFADLATTLAALLVLNLLLGAVNLVPAYPLDGGRIVRAFFWRRSGSERSGWRAAATSGRLSGLIAIGFGLYVLLLGNTTNGAMIALSGWFLLLSARTIRDRVRVEELIGGLHVRDAMDEASVTVHPALTVDTFAGQLLEGESPTTAVTVTDGDAVVGIVGVRQVRGLRRDKWATTRVESLMVKPPRMTVLSPDDDLPIAVASLTGANLDGLPVVEDGALVGVMTRAAIGRVVAARMPRTGPGRTL